MPVAYVVGRDCGETVKRNGYGYTGMRATVLGMARQGLAAARFLLAAGAQVTVSDQRDAERLASAVAALTQFAREHDAPLPVFALGGHPLGLLDQTDLLLLSGGVSPAIPIAEEARRRGIPLTNDGALTLRHCPAPVIGITGSAGKTTTTTLTGLMLERAGYRVHVGGNIGTPLIDRLDQVQRGDKVVLELSSFQLELMDRSPAIAALLNITPNHLDRHPSMSHYAAAKSNILRFQERGNIAVLNAEDPYTGAWLASGRVHIDPGAGQEEVYFPLQAAAQGFSLDARAVRGRLSRGRPPGGRAPRAAPARPARRGHLSRCRRPAAGPAQPGQHTGRRLPGRKRRRPGRRDCSRGNELCRGGAPA